MNDDLTLNYNNDNNLYNSNINNQNNSEAFDPNNHENRAVMGFKRVESNKLSIMSVQLVFCTITLILVLVLKIFMPDMYLKVKDWYKVNVEEQTSVKQITETTANLSAGDTRSTLNTNSLKTEEPAQNTESIVIGSSQNTEEPVTETATFNNYYAIDSNSFFFPLTSYTITSLYGSREDPFTLENANHSGIDLAADEGSSIYAVMEGTATVKNDEYYGNYVIIKHSETLSTLYGHCSSVIIKDNQVIKKGQQIALVGSTGRSTGPHLHFEIILNGQRINPQNFINF